MMEWLDEGIVQPSYSDYNSIVLVKKKDGTRENLCRLSKIIRIENR